eukprot:5516613-Amphidinium_carterae.1
MARFDNLSPKCPNLRRLQASTGQKDVTRSSSSASGRRSVRSSNDNIRNSPCVARGIGTTSSFRMSRPMRFARDLADLYSSAESKQ